MLEDDYAEVDSLVEQAHARRKEIDAERAGLAEQFGNMQNVPHAVRNRITLLDHEANQIDGSLRGMLNSPHMPANYQNHYNQKYMTPQNPQQATAPVDEGPSFWDRVKKGVGDTFDYAVQQPVSALKHIEQGKNELVSAPFRAIESLLTDKRYVRGGMDRQKQDVAAYDQSRGVDTRGTGPVVAETLGQMAVPLPMPSKLAPKGNLLGDFAKGAAYSGTLHAVERRANDEPVADEGLVTSMLLGGGLSSLLGRFASKTGVGSTGSAGSQNGGVPPSTAPPNVGGTRDNVDASIVRTESGPLKQLMAPAKQLEDRSAMPMGGPPPQLPPPEPKPVSPFRDLMESVRTKTERGEPLSSREQGFALWYQQHKGTPPPNAAGMKEEVNVPTRSVQAQAAPVSNGPSTTPIEQLLRKEPPVVAKAAAPPSPVVAAPTPRPQPKPQPPVEVISPKQAQAIPPSQIIDVAKQVDNEVQRAGHEALLKDVVAGKVKANDVKVKPKKGDAPIAAVQGEVGAVPKPVEVPAGAPTPLSAGKPQEAGRPPQSPAAPISPAQHERKVAPMKPKVENVRLEDYIAKQGYKLEEKEPFPGEKSYNVKDPVTGDTIARGDREQLLNALNARNEGRGFKLYSGVDPTPLYEKIKTTLRGLPDDVEVKNSPHREGPVNMTLRTAGIETPQFSMRNNPTGKKITDRALDFEDLQHTRMNDLYHQVQKDGTYKPTKAYEYFAGSAADRQKVNDVLVVGDRIGEHFDSATLAKSGLSTDQIRMYEGVREALDKARGWFEEIGTDVGKLKGYIPRVWNGELELFVDGKKYIPKVGDRTVGSSFSTLHEAAPTMWKLKQENPGAKIEAKFFSDPNYLDHRGIRDAKEVGNIKAKLDKMGALTKEQMDEVFHASKSYKDFARHLLERGDAQGYETENLEKVLFSYFNQAAKAVEGRKLRDAVEKVMKDEGTNLSATQVKYLESYVDRVLGKPTWDELFFKSVIRDTKLGTWLNPSAVTGTIKSAKNFITYKSLGFGNVSWALVNLDSLSRHVWPMLQRDAKGMGNAMAAEKYMSIGMKEFFNNPVLRQKLAHNNVIDIQHMSEAQPTVQAHLGKWTASDAIMLLGKYTEEFVRGVGAIARYRMALDQGHNEAEALRVASRFVAETVGRYTKAGKPQAFTGGVGSTVGMFKTYPIVMLQNMFSAFGSKDPGVILRYMLASLAAGGVIGAIPGSEEIDNLATRALGMSPIQWGYQHLGEGVMTGLSSMAPGNAATDLSRKAGLPDIFPNTTKDWLGPVWNTYGQAIADAMNGESGEAIKDLVPTSIKNIMAVSTEPGKVVGRYDKPVVELPPGTAPTVMRGLGFQSPRETRALRDYEYLETLKSSHEGELKQLTRRIYKGTATPEEQQRFAELGGNNRRIQNEGKRETLTLRQRQERSLPRLLRGQRDAP